MKVLLATHGTRGDVQPFLALAVALRQHGHQALLAAPGSFAAAAAEYDVAFTPLDEGPNRLLDDPVARRAMDHGFPGLRGKITGARMIARIKLLMKDALRDLASVARANPDVDVVVHPPPFPAHHVAEMLDVPAAVAALQPGWVPTSAFPCPMLPLPSMPRMFNRSTYLAVAASQRSGTVSAWRAQQLGLPPRRASHHPLRDPAGRQRLVLQAFSRHVTPVDPAWTDSIRTTGFWFLPSRPSWRPPHEMVRFLQAGPPPVYLGFSSMVGPDARRTGQIISEAVRRANVRAVVAVGWGGVELNLPSADVLVIKQAPHDWLFPRMAAVVHHGGAGTTGSALAAGRPQVVCPAIADQPHWAQRMHVIGVAPAPLHRRQLSAHRLAQAITRALTDARLRRRASNISPTIRAEGGVTAAVHALTALHTAVPSVRLPW